MIAVGTGAALPSRAAPAWGSGRVGAAAALGLALLASSGCATPGSPPESRVLAPIPDLEEERALEARLRSIPLPFEGFAPAEPGGERRVGDELVYGVEYRNGDETRTWLLVFRVESLLASPGQHFRIDFTDDQERTWGFSSPFIEASVRILDDAGEPVEFTTSQVPGRFLGKGLTEACELFAGEHPLDESESLSNREKYRHAGTISYAVASMLALFRTLEENETLGGILWKIVERPSILSVLLSGGASVRIVPRFEETRALPPPTEGPEPSKPTYRLPVDIEVNHTPALRAALTVVESEPPLWIGAGVIAIDGQHPRDASRRVAVRLLASRRGEPVGEGSQDGEGSEPRSTGAAPAPPREIPPCQP